MDLALAISGIIALIVIHEAGHFLAAKALGMRVERFSIFFPPKIFGVRRGETEYMIGAIPLGGYVKIWGMTPEEVEREAPEARHRAFCNQAPWKRIVVILAGPGMNILLTLFLFAAIFWVGNIDGAYTLSRLDPSIRTTQATTRIAGLTQRTSSVLQVGDKIVSADRKSITLQGLRDIAARDLCPGPLVNSCTGRYPITLGLRRAGKLFSVTIKPYYDASTGRMLFGFYSALVAKPYGPIQSLVVAARESVATTGSLISGLGQALASKKARKNISSIVGVTYLESKAISRGWGFAFVVLGLISLTLGVVNLFPFLPLDGGHILWAVLEKIRGKRISTLTMYRISIIGIVLLAYLIFEGVLNDISRLS